MLSLVILMMTSSLFPTSIHAQDVEKACIDFIDCFNCSFVNVLQKCQWKEGSCQNAASSSSIAFQVRAEDCDDSQSLLTMQTYCGPSTLEDANKNDDKGTGLLEVEGRYGTPQLFCKYTFYNDDEKKNVLVNVKLRRGTEDSSLMRLDARFYDGSSAERTVDRYDYVVSVEKGREINLFYYTNQAYSIQPFTIFVRAEKPGVSITLIITIILVIAACIICSVSIFIFSKRLARRNAMAHRNMMVGVIVNQQGVPISVPMQESQEELKKRKAQQLDQLLKESLIQRNFNEDLGKYNLNCTICLEEYTTKSIVCLTTCNHVFHYDCLSVWLTKNLLNSKCPNCNFHLLPELNETANIQISNVNNANSVPVQNVFVSSSRVLPQAQQQPQPVPMPLPMPQPVPQPVPNQGYNSINANNINHS